ncbi:SI1L2-like protein [Mya arenaria]|uniref:SI1L2-like protein n=1 Tax=Mya arenaria TaxID=6604 RepID=A0ABY7FGK7_MYAAR|nr:SI1L2-like protein [Mya arenaria]
MRSALNGSSIPNGLLVHFSPNPVSARKTLTTTPPKFVQRLITARAKLAEQRWSSVQDFCVGLADPSVHELASSESYKKSYSQRVVLDVSIMSEELIPPFTGPMSKETAQYRAKQAVEYYQRQVKVQNKPDIPKRNNRDRQDVRENNEHVNGYRGSHYENKNVNVDGRHSAQSQGYSYDSDRFVRGGHRATVHGTNGVRPREQQGFNNTVHNHDVQMQNNRTVHSEHRPGSKKRYSRGLHRSNSNLEESLEYMNLENLDASLTTRKGYGSTSSLDNIMNASTSSDSFFQMLENLRPETTDQRSPAPSKLHEVLRGSKTEIKNQNFLRNLEKIANGDVINNRPLSTDEVDEGGQSPRSYKKDRKSRSKSITPDVVGPGVWKRFRGKGDLDIGAKTDSVPDLEVKGDERCRRKAFVHYDSQSIGFDVNKVLTSKKSLTSFNNVSTGASAASGTRESFAADAEAPDIVNDDGDGQNNELVHSCSFFRNEIGGEEERIVGLTQNNANKQSNIDRIQNKSAITMNRSPECCGVTILDCSPTTVGHILPPHSKHKDHNYFGIDDALGPLAVSIRREKLEERGNNLGKGEAGLYQYRVIIRTSELTVLRGSILEDAIPASGRLSSSRGIPVKDLLEFLAPDVQASCLRQATKVGCPAFDEFLSCIGEKLLRKRHIGNDIVTIVFQEPGAPPFTPKCVRSQFQHVFIIVRAHNPCTEKTSYSIAVSRSRDVPPFGPTIPEHAKFYKSREFADFLLAKVINAENAAHHSEKFSAMAVRTRQEYLKDLATNYVTSNSLESASKLSKFVEDVSQPSTVVCYLGIAAETLVIVEESTGHVIFTTHCGSVIGWTSQAISGDMEELQEIVTRLRAVTPGCETQELTLKRNGLRQLGFHIQAEGIVTDVEQNGFAYVAGLRKGSRLVEICKVASVTLIHDQMVDLLRTSATVKVVVIPPMEDGSPRGVVNLHANHHYSSFPALNAVIQAEFSHHRRQARSSSSSSDAILSPMSPISPHDPSTRDQLPQGSSPWQHKSTEHLHHKYTLHTREFSTNSSSKEGYERAKDASTLREIGARDSVCSSQEYSSTRESTPRDCEERWELREIIRMNSRDSRDTLDSTDQEDGDYIHERESSVSSSHSQSSQRNSNTLPHQKNSSTSSDHRGEMKSPPNRTFYLSSDSGPWATSSLPRGSSNITQMPAFHGYQDSVVSSGRGSLFDGRLETGDQYGSNSQDAVSRRRANTTSSQSQGGGKAHIPGRIAELSSVSPLSSEHSSPRSSHNQSKNRRLSGRLVRTMSDESLHSGKGSLMLERDIRDVLFTDRKPDSQTSREHFRQHRLSPRALPDDTSRVTVPDSTASLDWSSLVDVATKAIEGSPEDLKDRISSPVNSTISSASSSSNLNKSGEIKVPSLYRPKHDRPPDPPTASNPPVWRSVVANPQQRINDLEMKVAQLEEELAQERQESAALDGEVQRLRTENARLQEESQNAAAQLRRFTEWFFTTIDRQ